MVILRTKSYIIFQNLPDHLQLAMTSFGKSKNFKCLFSKDTSETLELAEKVFHLLGVFVNSPEINVNDFEKCLSKVGFITSDKIDDIQKENQIEHMQSLLLDHLKELVPDSLKDLSKESFEHICKEFADIDATIDLCDKAPTFERNSLVSCESTGGNLSHYISFEFNSQSTFNGYPAAKDLLSLFREIANQTLGVINSQLASVPIHSRIGLPYSLQPYDVSKNPIKPSYYYPSVSFKCKEHNLLVTFGFLSIGEKLPDVTYEVKKASSLEIF